MDKNTIEHEFPKLPEFGIVAWEDFGLGDRTLHQGFTADQMLEYAKDYARTAVSKALESCYCYSPEHIDEIINGTQSQRGEKA